MGKEYKKLSREELYQQVWEKPMSQLAKQYGISDVGLAKICRKMGIPLPGRGHWARVSAGRIPPRPRLPSPKKGQLEEAYLNVKTNIKHQSPEQTEVDKIIAREKEADNQVIVREVLQDPHDLIVRTVKSLRGAKVNERQLVRPRAQSCLDVEVTKDSIDRAMRIMDALLKGLEERGYEISIDPEKKLTQVEMLKETLSIKLEERINRVDHVRTSQEEKRCLGTVFIIISFRGMITFQPGIWY